VQAVQQMMRAATAQAIGMSRVQMAFAALVLAQAHSDRGVRRPPVETFPPARVVSGMVSDDLPRGFVVANLLLVAFGLWAWQDRCVAHGYCGAPGVDMGGARGRERDRARSGRFGKGAICRGWPLRRSCWS
jgi:hypothetical protein